MARSSRLSTRPARFMRIKNGGDFARPSAAYLTWGTTHSDSIHTKVGGFESRVCGWLQKSLPLPPWWEAVYAHKPRATSHGMKDHSSKRLSKPSIFRTASPCNGDAIAPDRTGACSRSPDSNRCPARTATRGPPSIQLLTLSRLLPHAQVTHGAPRTPPAGPTLYAHKPGRMAISYLFSRQTIEMQMHPGKIHLRLKRGGEDWQRKSSR